MWTSTYRLMGARWEETRFVTLCLATQITTEYPRAGDSPWYRQRNSLECSRLLQRRRRSKADIVLVERELKFKNRITALLFSAPVLCISVVGLVVVSKFFLNYTGYCGAEWRYLSDEELVEKAVEHVIRTYPPGIDRGKKSDDAGAETVHSPPADPIRYQSVTDFLEENPDCCEIVSTGKEGFKGFLSSRLQGDLAKFVHIEYRVRYRDSEGAAISVITETVLPISNCGLVRSAF